MQLVRAESVSEVFLVPFLDLKAQYHGIKGEIDAAVLAVLESTQFMLGQYVADFEKEFAKYSGAAEGNRSGQNCAVNLSESFRKS